ncbi:hypothetical protein ZWY2020_035868 [Hordeum vulgare]|nr:hypothetical protein ZWY2020_035868 [Hordeum vulgare]
MEASPTSFLAPAASSLSSPVAPPPALALVTAAPAEQPVVPNQASLTLETKLLISEKKKEVMLAQVEARSEEDKHKADLEERMIMVK